MAIISYTSKTGTGQGVTNVQSPKVKKTENDEKKLTDTQKNMIGACAVATVAIAGICIAGKKGKGPLKKVLAQSSDDVSRVFSKEVMNEAGTQSTKYSKSGKLAEVSYFKDGKKFETVTYKADGVSEASRITFNPETQKPMRKVIHNEDMTKAYIDYDVNGIKVSRVQRSEANDLMSVTNYNPITGKKAQAQIYEKNGKYSIHKFNDEGLPISQEVYRANKTLEATMDLDVVTENIVKQTGFAEDGTTKLYEKQFWKSTGTVSKHLNFNKNGSVARERLYSNDDILLMDKRFDAKGKLVTQDIFRKNNGTRRAIVDFDTKTGMPQKTIIFRPDGKGLNEVIMFHPNSKKVKDVCTYQADGRTIDTLVMKNQEGKIIRIMKHDKAGELIENLEFNV